MILINPPAGRLGQPAEVCELFAMCSRDPSEVRSSLEAFARHGGLEGPHRDGWGIAYYADEDVRLVKEAGPASDSECMRFIQAHPFVSGMVISHIRKATQGHLAMKNCQPFARELGGRMHVFAHNGDLDFARLRERMPAAAPLAERLAAVAAFAAELRALGPANFLYADGDALFVHAHRRSPGMGAPPAPPGLHLLQRGCAPDQKVVLVASVPLSGEPGWRALREGELLVARGGEVQVLTQINPGGAQAAMMRR